MENFAEYILNEEDLMQKMEITYYLSRKKRILFDKSIIFKTEIARAFLNYAKLDVDKNLVLTACLLCNCKKVENAQNIESVHTYAKRGAEYLATLGFEKNFCNICEQVNRYSYSNPRSREGDILELVDEYGGFSGIVTVEDLIEEIMGEIEDEYDLDDEPKLQKIDDYNYIIDGNYLIENLDDQLDLKLNNINHDTISGFVIHLLGEIPSDNQERTVTYKNLTFKITGVKNNRITKIKLLIDKKVPEANQDD